MAWLISAAPADRRGELIGAALSAAIVGVLLGPVLGGAATVLSPEAVFSSVAVVAAGLAAWAWSMPGVEPEESPGIRAMLRALGRPAVLLGFWIFTIPALFSGVIEVLVPLRLDDLGVAGATIGAVFLVSAAVEAVVSPLAGRASDRAGRMAPIRAGLIGATVMAIVCPSRTPRCSSALTVVLSFVALATFWAPGMAMLSDAAEAQRPGPGPGVRHLQPRLGARAHLRRGRGRRGGGRDDRLGALHRARRAVRAHAGRANGEPPPSGGAERLARSSARERCRSGGTA